MTQPGPPTPPAPNLKLKVPGAPSVGSSSGGPKLKVTASPFTGPGTPPPLPTAAANPVPAAPPPAPGAISSAAPHRLRVRHLIQLLCRCLHLQPWRVPRHQ